MLATLPTVLSLLVNCLVSQTGSYLWVGGWPTCRPSQIQHSDHEEGEARKRRKREISSEGRARAEARGRVMRFLVLVSEDG